MFLIATDAAGEGVNLHRNAHLLINYDLPWNPNRIEQRFGRIHRIGQPNTCFMWSLVAQDTREGDVYGRLLEKLEEQRAALGGRVYDVLGQLFQGNALRDLMIAAIKEANKPERRALPHRSGRPEDRRRHPRTPGSEPARPVQARPEAKWTRSAARWNAPKPHGSNRTMWRRSSIARSRT